MTTAEAIVLAWICQALNEHVADDLFAEVVRDPDGVVRQPRLVLRTAVAGRLVVTVEEQPEPAPDPDA